MSSVRCAAYNVGASSKKDFTSGNKAESFNAKVTGNVNYSVNY